ncbi:MAG: hypothetical protein Q8O92_01490 [Candidatus Latescibacter sp.]|nr:hypothetical protein [Candidatus Latescibacter sp.]
MSIRIRFLTSVLTFLMGIALFAGCNIFSFAGDTEKTPIEKAEEAIRDGNYAQAKQDLVNQATGALIDSTDSMVLYTYSKATLLQSGLNITRIVDLVQSSKGSQAGTGSLALLTTLDQMGTGQQTAWYKANVDITQKLSAIWNNTARGDLQKKDIALDYTVSSILSGVLSLRDTNGDGVIDSNDFQLNLGAIKTGNLDGYKFTGASITDATGKQINFDGLTAFLGQTAKPAGITAGVPGYTPDDINRLINIFLNLLENGEDSIVFMVQNSTNTTFDTADIKKYVHQIASIINFYWYDDGIDNDGDGRVDEEVIDGKDNDGDGLTDEDSKYYSTDPTNVRNTQYRAVWEKWRNK